MELNLFEKRMHFHFLAKEYLIQFRPASEIYTPLSCVCLCAALLRFGFFSFSES